MATLAEQTLTHLADADPRELACLEDPELVQRTLAGETEAFSELVKRHEQVVYNVAYRFMRDAVAAEDMSQEAFLKAFRLLKTFRGESRFSTWLYRVACTVCLTELNRRKRRNEVPIIENGPAIPATEPEGADDIPAILRQCVAELPERYASIITQYYLEERPYQEIAESLDVPTGTLKTWMFRARKQLRKIVDRELRPDAIF